MHSLGQGSVDLIIEPIMTEAETSHQSRIEAYLEKKRESIKRLDPKSASEQVAKGTGATIIDTRPESFRAAEGAIPGALIIERYPDSRRISISLKPDR